MIAKKKTLKSTSSLAYYFCPASIVCPHDIQPRHTSNTERTGEEKVFHGLFFIISAWGEVNT
jgi:hypothetical protein